MATYSDNFDRANDPDDLGADWTTDLGELNISGNLAVGVSGASDLCTGRYTASAMDSANYNSKVTIDRLSSTGGQVTARATPDPYYYCQEWQGTWSNHELKKKVSGGFTQLDTWADSGESDPAIAEVECDGSTIKGYIAEAEVNSATDSDLTAIGAPGISTHWDDSCTFNDWSAEDLAGGEPTIPGGAVFHHRQIMRQ